MPNPRKITITITPNPQPAPRGGAMAPILISVSEDPVDLKDLGTGANGIIQWDILDNTGAGWVFSPWPNGVVIANASPYFQDNKHSNSKRATNGNGTKSRISPTQTSATSTRSA